MRRYHIDIVSMTFGHLKYDQGKGKQSVIGSHRELAVDEGLVQRLVSVEFVLGAQPAQLVACEHGLSDSLSGVLAAAVNEPAGEDEPAGSGPEIR